MFSEGAPTPAGTSMDLYVEFFFCLHTDEV